MLYSLKKRDRGHERTKDKSTPHLSHSPIICNNNTMDIEFLVQMRQSDKCGGVRNDDIFNLHLGSGAGPCLTCGVWARANLTAHVIFGSPKSICTCAYVCMCNCTRLWVRARTTLISSSFDVCSYGKEVGLPSPQPSWAIYVKLLLQILENLGPACKGFPC